jgi:hypothetical protein
MEPSEGGNSRHELCPVILNVGRLCLPDHCFDHGKKIVNSVIGFIDQNGDVALVEIDI